MLERRFDIMLLLCCTRCSQFVSCSRIQLLMSAELIFDFSGLYRLKVPAKNLSKGTCASETANQLHSFSNRTSTLPFFLIPPFDPITTLYDVHLSYVPICQCGITREDEQVLYSRSCFVEPTSSRS